MSEFYTELLVKRKQGAKELFVKISLIALILLVIPTIFIFTFGLVLVVITIGLAAFMFARLDVEYEYLYFNGDLDVDVIFHKTKRKRVFTVNVSEMEIVAPINAIEVKHYEKLKTYDYSSGTRSGNEYVIIVSQNGQKGRVIFEPNEKIVEDLFWRAPRKVIRK